MFRWALIGLVLVAAVSLSGDAWGQRPSVPPQISVEQQMQLKRRLLLGEETLLSTLRRNVATWEKFSPEQRRFAREQAYLFRDARPEEQQAIFNAWASFVQMEGRQQELYRQRAAWLKVVLADLTQDRKALLLSLSPTERAKELLRLKARMQAEGKLPPDLPGTAQ